MLLAIPPSLGRIHSKFTFSSYAAASEGATAHEQERRLEGGGTKSGDFASGFFEEVVDQGLVGLGLFGGHAAELAEQLGGDADGDELLGVAGGGSSNAAGAAELGIGGFRDVGEVDAAIRNRLGALCALCGAR